MITFENVSFSYTDRPLLENVSFSLPASGTVCFSGPSGCGKTTLLRLIADLEKPTSGHVHRPNDVKIAMVFQEDRLLPWFTVWENLTTVCDDPAVIHDALQIVSLTEERDRYPHELSGGMRRRVALARAIAYGGDILILDEPFNGIDEDLYRAIAQQLRVRYKDKLIILVTHSDKEPPLFDATVYPLTSPLSGRLF